MSHPCARCGRQLADGSVICRTDALSLSEALREAGGHAEDAQTVIARQARYGTGSRGTVDPMPVDLTASARLAHAGNAIGTWQRVALDDGLPPPRPWRPMVGPLCQPRQPGHDLPWPGHRCPHDSCSTIRDRTPPSPLGDACRWLAGQVEWLRHQPAADEAFDELHTACRDLTRLVDRPPERDLVGVCDCGRVLYAVHGRQVVTCPQPTCQQVWHVERSRDILLRHLADRLVTAAEAAHLAAYLDTDRTQEQIRKLINQWAGRGFAAKGHVWREPTEAETAAARETGEPIGPVAVPTYRFGDVSDRLARTPRRTARERAKVGG